MNQEQDIAAGYTSRRKGLGKQLSGACLAHPIRMQNVPSDGIPQVHPAEIRDLWDKHHCSQRTGGSWSPRWYGASSSPSCSGAAVCHGASPALPKAARASGSKLVMGGVRGVPGARWGCVLPPGALNGCGQGRDAALLTGSVIWPERGTEREWGSRSCSGNAGMWGSTWDEPRSPWLVEL